MNRRCSEKEVDLERGDTFSSATTEVEELPSPTSTVAPSTGDVEEDINQATGQTGRARRKQFTREWQFFPACERQTCMVLDYLAANLWAMYNDIELLERQNRESGSRDYTEHIPEGKFGEEKGKLMEQMAVETERYLSIFSKATIVWNQSAPHHRTVTDFKYWARDNIAHEPSLDVLCANNYKVLGPPPSTIDGIMHRVLETAMGWYYRISKPSSRSEDCIFFNCSYTVIALITHLIMILLALFFLVLPITLIYLLDLSKCFAVLLVVLFCLVFCLVFFVFGRLNTDHKFVLLFAYTGVMATLLSNLEAAGRAAATAA